MIIANLHHITQETVNFTHQECALRALKGGVKWIQLRVKDKTEKEVLAIAKEVKTLCNQYDAQLIINDYLEIAKELDLDGIHLGMTDTSTKVAREVLGKSKIIGGTANTLDHILYHYENGVDYVGVGPYRFTSTKDNLSPILGLDGYGEVLTELEKRSISLPVVAIGGIQIEDFQDIFTAGIHGIALASVINLATDPVVKSEEVMNEIERVGK